MRGISLLDAEQVGQCFTEISVRIMVALNVFHWEGQATFERRLSPEPI